MVCFLISKIFHETILGLEKQFSNLLALIDHHHYYYYHYYHYYYYWTWTKRRQNLQCASLTEAGGAAGHGPALTRFSRDAAFDSVLFPIPAPFRRNDVPAEIGERLQRNVCGKKSSFLYLKCSPRHPRGRRIGRHTGAEGKGRGRPASGRRRAPGSALRAAFSDSGRHVLYHVTKISKCKSLFLLKVYAWRSTVFRAFAALLCA